MFNIKSWLVDNLISAYTSGQFSRERTNLLTADYMVKGLLDVADVARVAEATAVVEVVEEAIPPEAEA